MPKQALHHLLNTPDVELWPAWLAKARSNADARVLAWARWLLRRKRDGRFLAAALPDGLLPLLPGWTRGIDSETALDVLANQVRASNALLPLEGIQQRLDILGLDARDYEARTGLELVAEPALLRLAGFDRYRRPLWLTIATTRAWQRLRMAALHDGIVLNAISGYRSHAYQLAIFERKRARGQGVAEILEVNAAPGYSEHHSGRAVDIGTPGQPPAEESFELTPAFAWLHAHAGEHGFRMSFPRDNPHGIVHEPWHWYFAGE